MPKNALRRFWTVYLLELRLTFSHWSYLVFLAIWSVVIIVQYSGNDFAFIAGLSGFLGGVISLIALFFAGLQATRVTRNRFEALEVALPTGVEVFLARWLATATTVASLLIAPLVVLAIAPRGRLESDMVWRVVGIPLLMITFATGLIWLLQTLLGIRRWMYPFFAVFWLVGGMIPNTLQTTDAHGLKLPIPGAHLLDFISLNQGGDSLWGMLTQKPLPTLTLVFYAGLVGLFVAIMVWRTSRVRFYRHSVPALALAAIAVGVVLVSGADFSARVHAMNQAIRTWTEEEFQAAAMGHTRLPGEMPFAVAAYDLTFALGSPSRLTAAVDVVNRSNAPLTDLQFSLYRQFTVTHVSLPFSREDDTLMVTLPQALAQGQRTHIRIDYEGNIQFFSLLMGRPPASIYFIDPEGVNLPCAVLWYPIPGTVLANVTTYDEYFKAHRHCLLDTPARFRLTVNEPGSLDYVTNLQQVGPNTFESAGATWAELIGAPGLERTTEGDMSIVSMDSERDTLQPPLRAMYEALFQHARRFFPDAAHLTIFALDMPDQSFSQWTSYPATAESVITSMEPMRLRWLLTSEQETYTYVGSPLIASILGQESTIAEGIAYFLQIHFQTNGDVSVMRATLGSDLPTGNMALYYAQSYEQRYQIASALFRVYETHGEDAMINLLGHIRENLKMLSALPPEQVVTWIEETANAD